MELPERLDLFGTVEPAAPRQRLTAGALSCDFCEGQISNVRWGDVEVVRGVSYLLRDTDWGTVGASIDGMAVTESATHFEVRFRIGFQAKEGPLTGEAHLRGESDGRLTFQVRATAGADITTNRCGFVVLHPASAAGRALQVERSDGTTEATQFPVDISPSQPATDIHRLAYSPDDGVNLEIRFSAELPGDPAGKFEMEDQRNWSDASFKTYVGSLLDPWPYVLPVGQVLTQSISIHVTGSLAGETTGDASRTVSVAAPTEARMPAIGVGIPPGFASAGQAEINALRDLGAQWWIAEVDLRRGDVLADLLAIADSRSGLAVRMQLDVIADDSTAPTLAAASAAQLCQQAGLTADAVRLLPAAYLQSFQPTDRWPDLPPMQAYAHAAREHFPSAQVGGGMYTNFTELNRLRPPGEGLDFIGHLTCPIVHAADDTSVMQTHECLPHIVSSVRSHWPGVGYRLGPTSIAPRRNPYGAGTCPNPDGARLALAASDPRHAAQFGAAWLVGYATAVSGLSLDVLGLLDSHGPSGPIRPVETPPRRIPAWSVLQQLSKAAGARWVPLQNLDPRLAGIAWMHDDQPVQGLIANLSAEPVQLRWATLVEGATGVLAAYEVSEFTLRQEAHDSD